MARRQPSGLLVRYTCGAKIVLLALLTGGAAYMMSKAQTPQYRSSVRISVMPARLDWGLQQTVKQVMRNYAQRIKSVQMAQTVAAEHQLDLSPYDLAAKITVSPIESDLLLQVDVVDTDPMMTQKIANAVAEEFVAEIKAFNQEQRKEDRVDVSILEYAGPGTLFRPRPTINAIAGALLGVVIGGLIVLALEFMDNTIKTSEDIKRYVGANVMVLGKIPPAADLHAVSEHAPRATRRPALRRS